VVDSQQNFVYYEWFDALNACADGICVLPKDLWFGNGDYGWWIATFENGQQSIYNQAAFSVDVIEPSIVDPETPFITPRQRRIGSVSGDAQLGAGHQRRVVRVVHHRLGSLYL